MKSVIEKDGLKGLFGRGLQTRLITNIAQSMVFSVFWKAIEAKLNAAAEKKKEKQTAKTGSITLAALPELKGGVPPLKHA